MTVKQYLHLIDFLEQHGAIWGDRVDLKCHIEQMTYGGIITQNVILKNFIGVGINLLELTSEEGIDFSCHTSTVLNIQEGWK